jgi:hypothetical protein
VPRSFIVALLIGCIETEIGPTVDPAGPPSDLPADPLAPVADAGESFSTPPLAIVTLDGTASYDPSDLPIVPTWRLSRAPKGSAVEFEQTDSFEPSFFVDLAGIYEVELTVVNSEGRPSRVADTVRVLAVPAQSVFVQLTWDATVDLDLHLLPDRGHVFGPGSCSWCNPAPDWGVRGDRSDDPSLDADTIEGYGPETISIPKPAPGTFTAAVHYYGQGGEPRCGATGCPPTLATVELYVDGVLASRVERPLHHAGQVWEVFSLSWEDLQRVDHGRVFSIERHSCLPQ